MEPIGLLYILPAIMIRELQWVASDLADPLYLDLFETFDVYLSPDHGAYQQRELYRERMPPLNKTQRHAFRGFFRGTAASRSARQAWDRVVAFDASSNTGDWFDAFWPERERPDTEHVIQLISKAFHISDPDPTEPAEPSNAFISELPARLIDLLSDPDAPDAANRIETLKGELHPNWGRPERAEIRRRLSPLNRAQRQAISAFADACFERSENREMWRNAAAHPDLDWFDALKAE